MIGVSFVCVFTCFSVLLILYVFLRCFLMLCFVCVFACFFDGCFMRVFTLFSAVWFLCVFLGCFIASVFSLMLQSVRRCQSARVCCKV